VIVKYAAKGPFRSFSPSDLVLFPGQLPGPLFVGFHDAINGLEFGWLCVLADKADLNSGIIRLHRHKLLPWRFCTATDCATQSNRKNKDDKLFHNVNLAEGANQ
jgi:hypothetical protein